jgi:hypothetical protein
VATKPAAAVLAALCLSGLGCPAPTVPSVPLDTLLAAPEAVELGGRTFVLETYLWRDFMPVAEVGGSDLMAVVFVTAVDLEPFPDDVDSNRLWVINGEDVWETEFSWENRPRDPGHPHQLEKYAGGGPKWPIGIDVDVVVRLQTQGGRTRLLRASGQTIFRTE